MYSCNASILDYDRAILLTTGRELLFQPHKFAMMFVNIRWTMVSKNGIANQWWLSSELCRCMGNEQQH